MFLPLSCCFFSSGTDAHPKVRNRPDGCLLLRLPQQIEASIPPRRTLAAQPVKAKHVDTLRAVRRTPLSKRSNREPCPRKWRQVEKAGRSLYWLPSLASADPRTSKEPCRNKKLPDRWDRCWAGTAPACWRACASSRSPTNRPSMRAAAGRPRRRGHQDRAARRQPDAPDRPVPRRRAGPRALAVLLALQPRQAIGRRSTSSSERDAASLLAPARRAPTSCSIRRCGDARRAARPRPRGARASAFRTLDRRADDAVRRRRSVGGLQGLRPRPPRARRRR